MPSPPAVWGAAAPARDGRRWSGIGEPPPPVLRPVGCQERSNAHRSGHLTPPRAQLLPSEGATPPNRNAQVTARAGGPVLPLAAAPPLSSAAQNQGPEQLHRPSPTCAGSRATRRGFSTNHSTPPIACARGRKRLRLYQNQNQPRDPISFFFPPPRKSGGRKTWAEFLEEELLK